MPTIHLTLEMPDKCSNCDARFDDTLAYIVRGECCPVVMLSPCDACLSATCEAIKKGD